jgi:hypothetical protein
MVFTFYSCLPPFATLYVAVNGFQHTWPDTIQWKANSFLRRLAEEPNYHQTIRIRTT